MYICLDLRHADITLAKIKVGFRNSLYEMRSAAQVVGVSSSQGGEINTWASRWLCLPHWFSFLHQ